MRALLLAAGVGSRLRPITNTVPKCLVPIHGRPLLDYWLDLLFARGTIERALINTHHLADVVAAHIAQSRWRDRIDLVYEPELLGTGGTIKANRGYFGAESFLVAHADNLTELDVSAFAAAHAGRPPYCVMSMLTFETDDPRSCGIVELDSQGVVQAFHEKVENPPGTLANAAVYMLTPEVADRAVRIEPAFVDFSTELIPLYLGRIFAVVMRGYHRDIGSAESLARAEREFLPRR
jgi:mannose-1-phosphate guanylyltransferase